MKHNIKFFFIHTEDLNIIRSVSPGIFKIFEGFFFFDRIYDKRVNIDYTKCRLQFYCLHHGNRRRFLILIHSVHVMACDLYKRDRFSDYMAFDCLLSNLLLLL